jgi:hypothetical protein
LNALGLFIWLGFSRSSSELRMRTQFLVCES